MKKNIKIVVSSNLNNLTPRQKSNARKAVGIFMSKVLNNVAVTT